MPERRNSDFIAGFFSTMARRTTSTALMAHTLFDEFSLSKREMFCGAVACYFSSCCCLRVFVRSSSAMVLDRSIALLMMVMTVCLLA
jgi:hypothetical protein